MPHFSTRLLQILVPALVLGSATAAVDGEPFLDLDLAQALERAMADEKPVFVAWSSAGNPECRRMELTYSDAAIAKWITEMTIPIMIDGDQERQLAVEYLVGTYPQVTLLDAEGGVLERIPGFFGSEDFMRRLEASVVASSAPVERPKDELEHDPGAWLAYGNYLYGIKQDPEEVVKAYFFCLDSGETFQPGFDAKYLDFLLNRMMVMHKVVPTRRGLRTRRDRLGWALSEGTASPREARAFLRYNFWLMDIDVSVAMYDRLAAGGEHEHTQELRAILFEELLVELVALRRYTDVLDSAGEVVPGLIARIEANVQAEDPEHEHDARSPKTDPSARDARNEIIVDAVHLYEAQLGVGRGAEAAELVDVLVEAFPSGRVYSLLMRHAMRVKLYDLARALAERGRRDLGDKAEKMIQRALRKLPPAERVGADKDDKGR